MSSSGDSMLAIHIFADSATKRPQSAEVLAPISQSP